MTLKPLVIATAAALSLLASPAAAMAQTDLQNAIEAGATQLSAPEIEALIVGNTVKAKAGEKVFTFHYSEDNVLSGKLDGGGWTDIGYYGITDDDRVCLSMTKDKGRLRCLTLMKVDGAVKKYNTDGKLTFEFLEIRAGNQL